MILKKSWGGGARAPLDPLVDWRPKRIPKMISFFLGTDCLLKTATSGKIIIDLVLQWSSPLPTKVLHCHCPYGFWYFLSTKHQPIDGTTRKLENAKTWWQSKLFSFLLNKFAVNESWQDSLCACLAGGWKSLANWKVLTWRCDSRQVITVMDPG